MNKTQEFIKLVQENPDLPIVPMVYGEIVDGDHYSYWMGSFCGCEITEYVCFEGYQGDRFYTRDEQDEIEEYFANSEVLVDLSDEEAFRIAHEQAEALDWEKAIVVWIGTP